MDRAGACPDAGGLTLGGAYAVLGLDRGASLEQIQSSFRKQALKHHPDRGGDGKRIILVYRAHNMLIDDWNRRQGDGGKEAGTEQDPLVSFVLDLAMRLIARINEQSWSGFGKVIAMILVGVGGALVISALADRSGEPGQ